MTVSLKPERLRDNMYFIDSFPVTLYYKNEQLFATVRSPTQSWTVSAPGFGVGEWHFVEITWHQQDGEL